MRIFVCASVKRFFPGEHKERVVGNEPGVKRLVRREDDAGAPRGQRLHEGEDHLLALQVKRRRGFVKKQKFGPARELPCNDDELLLTARKPPEVSVGEVFKSEAPKRLHGRGFILRFGEFEGADLPGASHENNVENRVGERGGKLLRNKADAGISADVP